MARRVHIYARELEAVQFAFEFVQARKAMKARKPG